LPHQHVTGFWFLDEPAWIPPSDLQDFLDNGEPPVYIGFGSMAADKPEATAKLVIDAATQANVRAVISTGWRGMDADDLPAHIYRLDTAPHAWLFPKMRAVVHHGGAGTTAAGLRAGVPTAIIPFFADQPYWGQQIYRMGLGTVPIPRKALTVEKLAAALIDIGHDEALKNRAAIVGERVRGEEGGSAAVRIIEEAIGSSTGWTTP
jgi:sterol 3beta-glucosyltransferase